MSSPESQPEAASVEAALIGIEDPLGLAIQALAKLQAQGFDGVIRPAAPEQATGEMATPIETVDQPDPTATVTSLDEYRHKREQPNAVAMPDDEDTTYDAGEWDEIEAEVRQAAKRRPKSSAEANPLRPLTPAAERRLIDQIKAGNMAAGDELCRHYLPYAKALAYKYGKPLSPEEAVQIALMQVVPVAAKHDHTRQASLKGRLFTRMRGAISDEKRDGSFLSRSQYKTLRRLEKIGLQDPAERDRQLHALATAKDKGGQRHPNADLVGMFAGGTLMSKPASLSRLVEASDDSGDFNYSGARAIRTSAELKTYDATDEALITAETMTEVRRFLPRLSPRERQVINLYYGLSEEAEELKQLEIGNRLGLTESAISNIRRKGLAKLQTLMSGEKLPLPSNPPDRLRILKTRRRSETQLAFLERVYGDIKHYDTEPLYGQERETLLGALPPLWKSQEINNRGTSYWLLQRGLPSHALQEFDLTPYQTERRTAGWQPEGLALMVKDVGVAELEAVISIEQEVAGHDEYPYREHVANLLSEQELAVLSRLYRGLSEIAHDMTLATSTIRTHMHNASDILEIPDRRHTHLGVTMAAAGLLIDPIPREKTSELTPRQQQVLTTYYETDTYEATAAQLDLSISTVRSHLLSAYKILGVHGPRQASIMAFVDGLIPSPDLSRYAPAKPETQSEPALGYIIDL